MTSRRSKPILESLLILLIVTFASFQVASSEGSLLNPPEDMSDYLFYADFSQDPIGHPPNNWRVFGGSAYVHVIDEPEMPSGKALRIASDPGRTSTSAAAELWGFPDPNVNAIVIEHRIKWVQGKNNLYVSRNNQHFVHWWMEDSGEMAVRSGATSRSLAHFLNEGWNQIWLVADRRANELFVYLNNNVYPIAGPLAFRQVPDTWEDASVIFSFSHSDGQEKEMFIGEVKVWTIDDEQMDQVRKQAREAPPVRFERTVWAGDISKRPEVKFPVSPFDASVSREQVPLVVSERHGIRRSRQPVSSGVPIPRGRLWNLDNVRLMTVDNQEIPIQKTVLSRWPDGSIRWLLLDFQIDVEPYSETHLVMEYGSLVASSKGEGITIREDGDHVTVLTGELEWTFSKSEPVGLPQLTIEDRIGRRFASDEGTYDLSIEEVGAERAVIRVQGEMGGQPEGELSSFAYDMRFHFYRDQSIVRVDPTITSLIGHARGSATAVSVKSVQLRMPNQVLGDGVRFEIGSEDDGLIQGTSAAIKLIQSHPTHYTVESDGQTISTGRRAPGWAYFEGDEQKTGVGVRHFWEQAPKAIEANGQGDLIVHLFHGEDTALPIGGGEAKRHEVYFSFAGEGDVDALRAMLHPLRAVAPPSWYSESRGFVRPLFLINPEDIPLYPASVEVYEEFVELGYTKLMQNRDLYNEYGWRNFGDWSQTWDPNGWGNIEYDLPYVYFLQFARKGDLRYFDLAETVARHWMDVDIIWATNDIRTLGIGIRHSTDHRTGNIEPAHTWLQGLVDYYHLTGDRRSLEAAQLIGDGFARWAYEGHPHLTPKSVPRTAGWILIGLMYLYESTLDPYYLEAAEIVVGILEEGQDEDGQWTHRMAEAEVPGSPMRSKPFMTGVVLRGLIDYHRVTSDPRVAEMIARGTRVLVEDYWSPSVRGFPYITDEPILYPPTPSTTNLLLQEAFLFTYRMTCDEVFLQTALAAFDSGIQVKFNELQRTTSNIGKAVAQTLRHTPHVMAELFQPASMAMVTSNIELESGQWTSAPITLTRYETNEPLSGGLSVFDAPGVLEVKWAEEDYTFARGQKSVEAVLEVKPTKFTEPGTYIVTVGDVENPDFSGSISMTLRGWSLADQLQPPIENSFWGGVLDRSLDLDRSEGWTYDGTMIDQFHGDAHRLVRTSIGTEYLIYDAPGLYSFEVIASAPFTAAHSVGEQIVVEYSVSDGPWVPIPTETHVTPGRGDDPIDKVVLSPPAQERYYRGENVRIRVTVAGGEAPELLQVGRINLTGWGVRR